MQGERAHSVSAHSIDGFLDSLESRKPMFDIKKTDSDLVAIKKFFGFKVNENGSLQTLKEFSAEVNELDATDKKWMADEIRTRYAE